MGVTGLLPFIEKATSSVTVNDIRGSTVAIDTYCWLHKGAFGCADKLVRGEDTDKYVEYCMKYVNMLLDHDITPILVFDGQHLPAKAETESKRRESRKQAKEKGLKLLRAGKAGEAYTYLTRCVDVTHEMALKLIQECRSVNVDCIVAPYEADAQLAYLNKIKLADYVITEDSDLVLFGCDKILFKLQLTGTAVLVEADKLHETMGCNRENYEFDKFLYMCILSGCDYLKSLPGVGLVKAKKFVLCTQDPDIQNALPKIVSYLKLKISTVPGEYIDGFMKAVATFRHMLVYDPIQRKQVRLNDLTAATNEDYCVNAGVLMTDQEKAFNLALGNLNPFSLKKLDDWSPDVLKSSTRKNSKSFFTKKMCKKPSIWRIGSTTELPPRTLFIRNKNTPIQKPETSTKILKIKTNRKSSEIKEEITDDSNSEDAIVNLYVQSSRTVLTETKCEKRLSAENSSPPKKKPCLESGPNTRSISSTLFSSTRTATANKKLVLSKFFNALKPKEILPTKSGAVQLEVKDNGIVNYVEYGEDTNSCDSQIMCTNNGDDEEPQIFGSQSSNIENICTEKKSFDKVEQMGKTSPAKSPKKSPSKLKPRIRVGLSKSAIPQTSIQSKLSQFGFQKKSLK